eukprot:7337297-Lingulodinium_polyedra.AAC.1
MALDDSAADLAFSSTRRITATIWGEAGASTTIKTNCSRNPQASTTSMAFNVHLGRQLYNHW